jgi:hypothetical protein
VFDAFNDQKLVGFMYILRRRSMSLADYNLYLQVSGFWLYSISAAFDPVQGLRNADATTILITIPSYNEEEFDCIIECQQHFKRLPAGIGVIWELISLPQHCI